LRPMIYEQGADDLRARLRVAGLAQSAQYLPDRILPQWEAFLRLVASQSVRAATAAEDQIVAANADESEILTRT
jgi:primosomal protein N''